MGVGTLTTTNEEKERKGEGRGEGGEREIKGVGPAKKQKGTAERRGEEGQQLWGGGGVGGRLCLTSPEVRFTGLGLTVLERQPLLQVKGSQRK